MKVGIVGVPMDLGQRRRGVDMGSTVIRIAGRDEKVRVLSHQIQDFGKIPGPDRSDAKVGDKRLRYLDVVLKICRLLADRVSLIVSEGAFPLVLGGDQSISIGTFAGLARTETKRGIIWMDAHADFNTPETTPSGSIHGMALASILGYGDRCLARFGGVAQGFRAELRPNRGKELRQEGGEATHQFWGHRLYHEGCRQIGNEARYG
jgi:arginase